MYFFYETDAHYFFSVLLIHPLKKKATADGHVGSQEIGSVEALCCRTAARGVLPT